MKKSEIVIGQEYAQRRGSYGLVQRVRVVGESRVTQGWGYNRKTITGTRAVVLDKETGKVARRKDPETGAEVDWEISVANREIQEPWVDYAEREAAMKKARQEANRRDREGRSERAAFLLDLIPALRHAGFLDVEASVYDSKTERALREHVPDCLGEETSFGSVSTTLKAPLAPALREYVDSGKSIPIPASELLRILDGRSVR